MSNIFGNLGAALLIGFCLFCYLLFRTKPKLSAVLSAPNETSIGSEIYATVTVSNPHTTAVSLGTIDIEDKILSGFQVLSIKPQPLEAISLDFLETHSWTFDTIVQPGDSLNITFTLKPIAEGRFTGEIDICNSNNDFTTLILDIVVKNEL